MHMRRLVATAMAALVGVSACSGSSTEDVGPGDVVDVVVPIEGIPYTPESRDALALGIPDQVGGYVLTSSDPAKIAFEEDEYVSDPRVRQILVDAGLSRSRVTIEQKSASVPGSPNAKERIPPIAIAAAQVKEVPAADFIAWDPSFYLLTTAVDIGDYQWQGEKPDDDPSIIADHEVRVADFQRFKVAWYPYGDVLYVVVAATDQLLEATIRRLPWRAAAA
jgi:hypothetical protein